MTRSTETATTPHATRYLVAYAGDLPDGYSVSDYWAGESPVGQRYATREEAEAAVRTGYRGPDDEGVEPTITVEVVS